MFSNILLEKLIRPSRAGGGLNESFNQIAQDALNRKLLESEALSKAAYANWVGPQSLMSFLNTPGVAKNIGDEQYNRLTQLANSMMGQSMAGAQQQTQPSNPFKSLVDYGVGLVTGRRPQQNPMVQAPISRGVSGAGNTFNDNPPQQPMNETTQYPTSGNAYSGTASPNQQQQIMNHQASITGGDAEQVPGATIPPYKSSEGGPVAPNEPVNQPNIPPLTKSGIPSTPLGKFIQSKKTQGEAGGLNKPALFTAEESAMQKYNDAQIANITEQQNKIYTQDSINADEALNQNTLIESMKESYKKLGMFEKGNWTKIYDKPLSNAAQELDAKTEQLVQSVSKNASVTGHVTDATRISAAASKTGRKFSDEAFMNLANYAQAQNDRMIEKPLFDQTFSDLGASPIQTGILWRYYNAMRPFYNNKTHKGNDDHLNSWDQFYSNKNNRDAAFSPTGQKAINKAYRQQEQKNMFVVISPNGEKIAQGNEEDVNNFLKAHKGYKKAPLK